MKKDSVPSLKIPAHKFKMCEMHNYDKKDFCADWEI